MVAVFKCFCLNLENHSRFNLLYDQISAKDQKVY